MSNRRIVHLALAVIAMSGLSLLTPPPARAQGGQCYACGTGGCPTNAEQDAICHHGDCGDSHHDCGTSPEGGFCDNEGFPYQFTCDYGES